MEPIREHGVQHRTGLGPMENKRLLASLNLVQPKSSEKKTQAGISRGSSERYRVERGRDAHELGRVLEEIPLGAVALGRPDRHHLLLLLRLRSIDAAATGRWSRRRAASGGAVSLVCRGRGGKRWMDGWDWREAERLDGSDRS